MMQRLLLLLLSGLFHGSHSIYIPGQPGAPWTDEEVLVVKSKLFQIMHDGNIVDQVSDTEEWTRFPSASKFVRLGFHDCLKYVDGSGGCDGCLNWEGVGIEYDESLVGQMLYDDIEFTNNNGLGPTVEVLEEVYTNKYFPSISPYLNISLRESGKSRADLWALAAISGVEFGIENNNEVCKDKNYDKIHPQCHHEQGMSTCEVNLPGPMQFKTGRADCITSASKPYITTKEEAHPSIMTNGEGTVEFFKTYFSFTGREMVALLGAHSLGRLHVQHSLLPYVWTSRGTEMLNNHYYKIITNKDEWYFNDDACTKVGDAFGTKPPTRWVPHVRQFTKNGGPVHWIHENYACPNCVWDTVDNDHHLDCCTNKPAENFCRPDNGRTANSTIADDDDFNGGCEHYRFIVGIDEMVLSAEMGLYKKFKVANNTPYGCEGLEDFNLEKWKEEGYHYTWPLIDGIKQEPRCPFQDLSEPLGSEPLYTIFEEFADDQNAWIRDFKAVFEKMLTNGYEDISSLNNGPDQYTNITCPRPPRWSGQWLQCYKNLEEPIPRDEIPFYIESAWTQAGVSMVMQMDASTLQTAMWEKVDLQENQLWRWSKAGTQLINLATNSTLNVQNRMYWEFSEGLIKGLGSNDAIDCYNGHNQVNGSSLVVYTSHGAAWQLYQLMPSFTPPPAPIETTGRAFYIESGWVDNGLTMVIQQNLESAGVEMWEMNGNLNQLWKFEAHGQRIINEQSNQPLSIGGIEIWNYTEGDPYGAINVAGSGACIDCYNGHDQVNGAALITWTCNEAPWQKYRLTAGPSTTSIGPPSITTTTTIAPTTSIVCIEENTFYGGKAFRTRKSSSAENCRQQCMSNRKCKGFVWHSRRVKKKKLRNKCQLKKKVGASRTMRNVFSGLKKNC